MRLLAPRIALHAGRDLVCLGQLICVCLRQLSSLPFPLPLIAPHCCPFRCSWRHIFPSHLYVLFPVLNTTIHSSPIQLCARSPLQPRELPPYSFLAWNCHSPQQAGSKTAMQSSLSFTRSGTLPDQTRFEVTYSTSFWQPLPEDLRLEKAIEKFASLRLAEGMGYAYPHAENREKAYAYERQPVYGYEVIEPIRGSSYARSAVSRRSAAVEPSRAQLMLPWESGNRASSSHSSRRSRLYEDARHLVRYEPARRHPTSDYAGAVDVRPEDSISQVSSYRAPPSSVVSRGRTRRREGSVASGSRWRGAREVLALRGVEEEGEELEEDRERSYLTRDVTPW